LDPIPGKIVYSRILKRISLQRYLVSKVIYQADKITPTDLIALYDNQLWLEAKCFKDYDFDKKFGKSLEVLSKILKQVNLSKGFSPKALVNLSLKFYTMLRGFMIPARNYQDYRKRFSGSFQVIEMQSPGKDRRYLPPKKVIGIGYRDKGTLKRPWLDGSPSWQEVACQAGQLAMSNKKPWKTRILEAKNVRDIEIVFRDLFGTEVRTREGTYYQDPEATSERASIEFFKKYLGESPN